MLATVTVATVRADEFIQFSDEQLGAVQHQLAIEYTANRISTDAVLQQYVRNLNERLGANPRSYVTFVRDKNLNAFAAWGNVIVLNSGILSFARSEDELVGVLAHEHAHISQRHFHRLPQSASVIKGVSTAGLLAALLTGNTELANVFAGTSGLAANRELAALRDFEREADQSAVRSMARSGFDTEDFLALLDRMRKPGDAGIPEYLRTHPISENRISDLKSFIRSLDIQGRKNDDRLEFWLVRERSNWLSNQRQSSPPPARFAQAARDYGLLLRGGLDSPKAAERLGQHAGNWVVALALADHFLSKKEFSEALAVLEQASGNHPGNVALVAKQLHALSEAQDRTAAVKAIAKMPSEMRLNLDIARAEARMWSIFGDDFNYRLAVGFTQYLEGNIVSAQNQVARLKSIDSSSISASRLGRLSLLEEKIATLRNLVERS